MKVSGTARFALAALLLLLSLIVAPGAALSKAPDPGSSVNWSGTGSVITVNVSDVRIEGLEISGSGIDLPAMDSAVLVNRTAERAVIRGNRLTGNLFGVYLNGAAARWWRRTSLSGATPAHGRSGQKTGSLHKK